MKWHGEVVATIDMFLSLFIVTLGLVMLVVPQKPSQDAQDRAVCSIAIDAVWPTTIDADVDLWGRVKGDTAVGYSSPHGKYMDLVRDDLGASFDATPENAERICGRGFSVQEYGINVHLFTRRAGFQGEVPVHITVSKINHQTGFMEELWGGDVVLKYQGQEITAVRFKLDGDGNIVSGSVHNIQKLIRNAQ